MSFAVGSLVQARGRDWVVLPESQGHDDLLVVRPLVGGDDEVTGIYLPLTGKSNCRPPADLIVADQPSLGTLWS